MQTTFAGTLFKAFYNLVNRILSFYCIKWIKESADKHLMIVTAIFFVYSCKTYI